MATHVSRILRVLCPRYSSTFKLASTIEIVPLSSEHFRRAIEVADAQLGPGFVTPSMLSESITRSTPPGCAFPISCTALREGRVVGFSLVHLPGQWESDGIPVTRDAWPCSDADKAAVAYHVVVAVDPTCSGSGIGMGLSRATEAALLATGTVRGLVGHVWEASSSAVAMSRRRGGTIVGAQKGVWLDCRDYNCSACGSPQGGCSCDAVEVFYPIRSADAITESAPRKPVLPVLVRD